MTCSSSSFSGLVSVIGRPEPSVVRSAIGTAPRWVTPANRAHSRSLAGRPGRQVLQRVMLGSQGMLRVDLLLLYIEAVSRSVFHLPPCTLCNIVSQGDSLALKNKKSLTGHLNQIEVNQ
ncbi:jg6182 [Pararge aegeria aegeria]|uniref:Jg6182 protein n=1 Tax=Pararge aegeria aegeria TaxID=348720 RepID=A0A8S4S4L2_9NEOP|nr:jg6182 [Pararge aegeria aegeria]